MNKIRNTELILFFISLISVLAFLLGQNSHGKNYISENNMSIKNNSKYPLFLDLAQNKSNGSPNQQVRGSVNEDGEETVIINVSNYGRSNPFKPFVEKSLYTNYVQQIDVPQPPEYNPDPNLPTLLGIKVSGILYDNERPSAIININNSDYLVHKGDFLFDFSVKNITANNISIKYKNNIYSAGIGEIIEGVININPVNNRVVTMSNPSGTNSSDIKLGNPVTLPTLPTIK
jgi:hypothetical protein